jgi:hypothetical protein
MITVNGRAVRVDLEDQWTVSVKSGDVSQVAVHREGHVDVELRRLGSRGGSLQLNDTAGHEAGGPWPAEVRFR